MSEHTPDRGRLGPAMKALPTDRMRAFVMAILDLGMVDHTRAAMMAGYASENREALRVQAHRLAHDERVQAAIQEEAKRRMTAGAAIAASKLVDFLNDPDKKVALRAIEMLMNRVGLHATTEHKVAVEHTLNEAETIARIQNLAGLLGVDAQQLLGAAGVALPAPAKPQGEVVDAEFTVVEPTSTDGLEDIL